MNVSKTVKRIAIDSLTFADNPRTPATMHLEAMVASYKLHGYQNDKPIMVEEVANGQYLVLRGNRRALAAIELGKTDMDAFNRVFSDSKIPAIMAKDLADNERILLRIDHSSELDRIPLDDEGLFLAVRQLTLTGLSQEACAEHLGLYLPAKEGKRGKPNRSVIQQRVNLAKLPKAVQSEYLILMRKGRDATPVRWGKVQSLYTAYKTECIEYPGGGPEFRKVWEKVCNPVKTAGVTTGGTLTASGAVDKANLVQARTSKALILAITGQGKTTLADCDVKILEGEVAIVTLQNIKQYLGDNDYNSLIADSIELAVEKSKVVENVA